MRNSFKAQESNKYLQESWEKANHDSKKTVLHIDEKSIKPNLTSGNISILSELKPQYDALKQEQKANTPSTPTTTTSVTTPSPTTTTSSSSNTPIGIFTPKNPTKPWGQ